MSDLIAAGPADDTANIQDISGGARPPPVLRGADVEGTQDRLTGLATRRSLIEKMQALLDHPGESARKPALILLDLDRFKLVNDSLGPTICDKLLGKIAQRLRTVVPNAKMIARMSGDGFAVLLGDGTDAPDVAAKLLEFLGRPYAVSGHAITLGASAGSAIAGQDGDDAISLLHAADLAMHQAEAEGRNRARHFEPSMQTRALSRHALETDLRAAMALQQVELRRALVSEQFEVHYQPQVSLTDGRLTGFEALLRWRHPERGLVPPDRFIPMAEEIGLIELLGDWVLRTACRDAMSWIVPPGREPVPVAVNVSPLQLRDGPALLAGIGRALAESGLPPARLEAELTESAMSSDIASILADIRRLGVGLALDDFGTGYSSLGRLRTLPFTKIKIDRSFIADLGSSADPGAPENGSRDGTGEWMIRAIASLGLGLGLKTVAEGIETLAQAEIARRAGVSDLQGYLVSRPIPGSCVNDTINRLSASNQEWNLAS